MANEKNSETAVEAKVATKKNAGKGRTPKSPVWKVLDDARKKFNAQSLRVRVSNVSVLRLVSASTMQTICGFGLIY